MTSEPSGARLGFDPGILALVVVFAVASVVHTLLERTTYVISGNQQGSIDRSQGASAQASLGRSADVILISDAL